MDEKKISFRIAARGLIVEDDQLLFVSDDGHYWYLPGGRVEGNECLRTCVEREVFEETGLKVKTGLLLHVLECFDLKDQLHKIHFYFQTRVLNGRLPDVWEDEGGAVLYRRFFSLEEIIQNTNILPRFLAKGDWCKEFPKGCPVYQGVVKMRGFEMVDSADEALFI